MSCAPLDRTKKFAWYIAIAFWDSNEIELISLKDTQRQLAMCRRSAPLPALPCSIVLHNFGTGNKSKDADFRPYVVAGLADGSVAMMSLVLQEKAEEMRDLKFFPLGNTPVSLGLTKIDDKQAVFASGSRAAVLYWDRQRVHHSAVMLKVSSLFIGNEPARDDQPCSAPQGCQSWSQPEHDTVPVMPDLGYLDLLTHRSNTRCRQDANPHSESHTSTPQFAHVFMFGAQVPLGLENPRRIAYHPALNVFGVVGTKNAPHRIGDAQAQTSTFNLYDGTTFARELSASWPVQNMLKITL